MFFRTPTLNNSSCNDRKVICDSSFCYDLCFVGGDISYCSSQRRHGVKFELGSCWRNDLTIHCRHGMIILTEFILDIYSFCFQCDKVLPLKWTSQISFCGTILSYNRFWSYNYSLLLLKWHSFWKSTFGWRTTEW